MYDFLFELTEDSDNEGEQILCEETSLDAAYNCLVNMYGFEYKANFLALILIKKSSPL